MSVRKVAGRILSEGGGALPNISAMCASEVSDSPSIDKGWGGAIGEEMVVSPVAATASFSLPFPRLRPGLCLFILWLPDSMYP